MNDTTSRILNLIRKEPYQRVIIKGETEAAEAVTLGIITPTNEWEYDWRIYNVTHYGRQLAKTQEGAGK